MTSRYSTAAKLVSLAAIVLLAMAGVAQAKTVRYSKSASSGKTKYIDSYFGWTNTCAFQTINVDVVGKPKHGRVTPKVEIKRIGRAQAGASGKCRGKKTRAISVYYRSARGYRGSDSFKIRMKVRGQAPVFFVYKIRVR